MKGRNKLLKNEEAVSPVIGVILMVAITVILAAVIASFVFGIGPTTQTAPTAQLVASDGPDSAPFTAAATNGPRLVTIQHKGGDTIVLSDTKVIFSFASNGTQIFSNGTWGSGTMDVGDIQYIYFNSSDNPSPSTLGEGTYRIQLIDKPTSSFLLDTKVTIS